MNRNSLHRTATSALLMVLAIPVTHAVSLDPNPTFDAPRTEDQSSPQASSATRLTCSNSTLSGTYTYQFEGTRNDGQISTREAGMEIYNGQGGISVIASFNSVPGGVSSFQTTQLTYVVNSNCTGVLIGSRGPYADIFIAPDGSSFTFVSNVAGQQISGIEHRVSKRKVKLK